MTNDQQPSGHGRADAGGPRGESDRGRKRQPEHKNRRERRGFGYDAGKRVKGRKRHIVTDTLDLMVGLVVHAAGIQDREGAPVVLKAIRARWPWLGHIFADGGYAGPKLNAALFHLGDWTIEIVKRSAKEWEKSVASAEAWVFVAHLRLLSRRLAKVLPRLVEFRVRLLGDGIDADPDTRKAARYLMVAAVMLACP